MATNPLLDAHPGSRPARRCAALPPGTSTPPSSRPGPTQSGPAPAPVPGSWHSRPAPRTGPSGGAIGAAGPSRGSRPPGRTGSPGAPGVEPGFQCAARLGAILHGHLLRGVGARPVDADLDEGPACGTADAEVCEIVAQGFEPDPKGLYETVGEHKKKGGPDFARCRPECTRGATQVKASSLWAT